MTGHHFEDDVYREKSLYDVFKASSVIKSSKFNKLCMILTYVACVLYVTANAYSGVENGQVLAAIEKLTASLITVTTAVLGFLIAGFSIFVSSTPNKTLIMLSKTQYKNSNISQFKQIMFNFLNVFTVYLLVLSASLAINSSAPLGHSPLLKWHPSDHLVSSFNSAVLAVIVIGAVYSTLRLKSFIWTMYQGLLVNMMLEKSFSQEK